MEKGLAEVLIGYRVDELVGPTVVLSAGGILSEVYGDAAVRIAPVSHTTALEMIEEVKGLAPSVVTAECQRAIYVRLPMP